MQDRPALGGVGPQQPVHPAPLPWGEAFGGLVEHERVRVSEKRGGETQPAVHARREGAEALVSETRQADDLQQFVRAGRGDSGSGAEHAELTTGRARRVTGYVAQQYADFAGGVADAVQGAAAEVGDAAPGFEFEHQPQGGGLAGTGRAEERGDAAGRGFEGQVVHDRGSVAAGGAGQSGGLEHRFSRGGGDRSAAGRGYP